jgi:hypothetical protein
LHELAQIYFNKKFKYQLPPALAGGFLFMQIKGFSQTFAPSLAKANKSRI